MSRVTYTVDHTSPTALSAGVARTVLAIMSTTNHGVDLLGFHIAFDGVNATAAPVFWELCALSGATNSTAGTGNTSESGSIAGLGGRTGATGFTAFSSATSEPTVLTPLEASFLTPNGGLLMYEYPFNGGPDSANGAGFAIRCTSPTAVNVRAGFRFART